MQELLRKFVAKIAARTKPIHSKSLVKTMNTKSEPLTMCGLLPLAGQQFSVLSPRPNGRSTSTRGPRVEALNSLNLTLYYFFCVYFTTNHCSAFGNVWRPGTTHSCARFPDSHIILFDHFLNIFTLFLSFDFFVYFYY